MDMPQATDSGPQNQTKHQPREVFRKVLDFYTNYPQNAPRKFVARVTARLFAIPATKVHILGLLVPQHLKITAYRPPTPSAIDGYFDIYVAPAPDGKGQGLNICLGWDVRLKVLRPGDTTSGGPMTNPPSDHHGQQQAQDFPAGRTEDWVQGQGKAGYIASTGIPHDMDSRIASLPVVPSNATPPSDSSPVIDPRLTEEYLPSSQYANTTDSWRPAFPLPSDYFVGGSGAAQYGPEHQIGESAGQPTIGQESMTPPPQRSYKLDDPFAG